jgi:metal transporter CNNM
MDRFGMVHNTYLSKRPLVLGLVKILLLGLAQLQFVQAAPLQAAKLLFASDEDGAKPPEDASLWLYFGVAAALVLLGGAFAGLTIALMGQVPPIDWLYDS